MLKLPKGLKKKKKKSKKDQELFTEEELAEYKRNLKAKQEALANRSDAGESDAASDVEGLAASSISSVQTAAASTSVTETGSKAVLDSTESVEGDANGHGGHTDADEEWAKFKALTSGVDSILHKTQDELDRIKKESFYQRLPSAVEKKRLEEEELQRREAARLEEDCRRAAEAEAKRDKLTEAVVELSESEDEEEELVDDIFATDYIEAITSGEVQLAIVPDSPIQEVDNGPDPFDTEYAEKVIVGADKAKSNKKLVSLGAAVEVLSGRVDREHALALAKPKRKLRKGIQNLLLSESVDLADSDVIITTSEPQRNLLDDLVDDVPVSDVPIDLNVSLHLHLIQPKEPSKEEIKENLEGTSSLNPDLLEFDTLKNEEDDEFAELAVGSLTKTKEVTKISQVFLPQPVAEVVDGSWAQFEKGPNETAKPGRPPLPGCLRDEQNIDFTSSEEFPEVSGDPFNTSYADQVIKKTTKFEEDDDFDPRAEELTPSTQFPAASAHSNLSATVSSINASQFTEPSFTDDQLAVNIDPFDTSAISEIVHKKGTEHGLFSKGSITLSLSDPEFDPRAGETNSSPQLQLKQQNYSQFDAASRKSSLNLNIQSKNVGFLVPDHDLLGGGNEVSGNKKPLTPYYAPTSISDIENKDPFDTSCVPDSKLTDIEIKQIEVDLLPSLTHSLSDPNFDPRAPESPVPAEVLLSVKENITTKVLTPAQEIKTDSYLGNIESDPFDTSIAANLKLGETELKLLESELLPETTVDVNIGVLDTQTDAQELGLGDKVLTPSVPNQQKTLVKEIDPFDTSIADNLAPGETEIKLLESELIER